MSNAQPGSSGWEIWFWNSQVGARGKITRIVTDGTIDVPDSSFIRTPDDPAALIQVFRDDEATDRYGAIVFRRYLGAA